MVKKTDKLGAGRWKNAQANDTFELHICAEIVLFHRTY